MINEMFLNYSRKVGNYSTSLGIPSIDEEEGFLIYSVVYTYSTLSKRTLYVIDAGAGIGYSTLWLAKALEDSSCCKCMVEALEINPYYACKALEVVSKYGFKNVHVEVLNVDAIEYVSKLKNETIDIAFVDIVKQNYHIILDMLASKLRKHGMIMFHNAIHPPPPKEFLNKTSKPPWKTTILHTSTGILLGFKIL